MSDSKTLFFLKQYPINWGLDVKFEESEDGFPPAFGERDIMAVEQWTELMCELNKRLQKHRHKKKDCAMLAAGPMLLPLVPFMIRHQKHKKRTRAELRDFCDYVNREFALRKEHNLALYWNRDNENIGLKTVTPRRSKQHGSANDRVHVQNEVDLHFNTQSQSAASGDFHAV
jgi:hypothetical protein